MTSAKKEKMVSSVQKKKKETKGEKKRLLLQEVAQRLLGDDGHPPSLNEAIIASAESFLLDMRLDPGQRSKIEQAAAIANLTPMQILDKACDWASRFYGSKYAGLGELGEKSLGAGGKDRASLDQFAPGSAYLRVHEFVQKLMKKNDLCKKKEEKVFINQTYLVKHQGSNRDAIRGYLHAQRQALQAHHQKHGLSPRHNVEVHSYRNRGLNREE